MWREWAFLEPSFDLHSLSHRALTGLLIPQWIREGRTDLDNCIESSAYGETPRGLLEEIFQALELQENDTFLDLGAGAGQVLIQASLRASTCYGIERNPYLVDAGRQVLEETAVPPENLLLADFLSSTWPQEATKAFSTTARFGSETIEELSRLLETTEKLKRLVTLGRPLLPPKRWRLRLEKTVRVTWNPGEASLAETFQLWARVNEKDAERRPG